MKTSITTKKLVEAALLIAIATVLSTLKLIDMPYGGSVTFASMLPVALIAYRHGALWGLGSAFTYGVLQQVLGLENFSYLPVPTPAAIIALIIFDYLLAFLALSLGGGMRGKLNGLFKSKSSACACELAVGVLIASVLRYICHVISGATAWAGLPIPDGAALIYSISYNATYMLPETIILVLVAAYLASAIDFTKSSPRPYTLPKEEISARHGEKYARGLSLSAALVIVGALIADCCMVFPHLQDADSGELTFAFMSNAPWTAFIIVTASAAVAAIILYIAAYVLRKAGAKE